MIMMMMYSSKVYDSICFVRGGSFYGILNVLKRPIFFMLWRLSETPQTFLALVAYVVVISCIKPGFFTMATTCHKPFLDGKPARSSSVGVSDMGLDMTG